VFLVLLLALWPSRRRVRLVPPSVRKELVRRRATEQFLAQNLHTTEGRTGVLIFVSVAEHRAEILADTGIDTRVPAGTWQKIVDALTREIGAGRAAQGFVAAIAEIGAHLARHFPPGAADSNELPDHLIVLQNDR
jgi:putative membrane protein